MLGIGNYSLGDVTSRPENPALAASTSAPAPDTMYPVVERGTKIAWVFVGGAFLYWLWLARKRA